MTTETAPKTRVAKTKTGAITVELPPAISLKCEALVNKIGDKSVTLKQVRNMVRIAAAEKLIGLDPQEIYVAQQKLKLEKLEKIG